jgi:hypothetical protein
MSKTSKLIGGLVLLSTALFTTPKQTQAQQACNLLCIFGDHCCIIHNRPAYVPDSQPCPT